MGDFSFYVYQGDCLDVIQKAPDNYFDAMVTDPPAGIGFMNRDWDKDKGGRKEWVGWMTGVMKEAMRVLKPGGHALVWAIPRTSHWTATALEDAGWEVRDVLTHHFGQGFPKSQNVAQFIDKARGVTEWKQTTPNPAWRAGNGEGAETSTGWAKPQRPPKPVVESDEAKEWTGWGTALKPASEHWILVRKPLSEKSVARNVLRWGTGALNIDGCRVHRDAGDVPGWHQTGSYGRTGGYLPDACTYCEGTGKARYHSDGLPYEGGEPVKCAFCLGKGVRQGAFTIRDMPPEEVQARCGSKGRWPPNVLLSHSPECRCVGSERVKSGTWGADQKTPPGDGNTLGGGWTLTPSEDPGIADADGMEEVEVWECEPGCPVAEIDRQSGTSKAGSGKFIRKKTLHDTEAGWGMRHEEDAGQGYGDKGGASRYFPTFKYQPKPSRKERDTGLAGLEDSTLHRVNPGGLENEPRFAPVQCKNNHPTVKSVPLMEWLTRLVTPPGGLVLDPFCGSGSTGVACRRQGFRFVGIEQDEHFAEIARARCAHTEEETHE